MNPGVSTIFHTRNHLLGGDSIYSRRFNSLPTDIENAKVEVESSSEWGAFLGRFGNEKTSIHIPLNIGSHLTPSETTGDDQQPKLLKVAEHKQSNSTF